MLTRSRLIAAGLVVIAALASAAALRLPRFAHRTPAEETAGVARVDVVPALGSASGWIHGDPSVLDSLAGTPVVIAVWSDTDPRCLEGLARVEGWHEAYRRYGVRVIGVYAPDFSFGVDSTVPLRIARRLGLAFPIALDPSYLVRSRLSPAVSEPSILVLGADAGLLARVGFERLDEVDRVVREELRRLRPDVDFPAEPARRTETAGREITFVPLGAGRAVAGPLATAQPGRTETFTTQFRFQEERARHVPVPVGRWTATAEGAVAARGGAADFIAIRNPGERMWAVMSPRDAGVSRVWVLADQGWLPPGERGADLRADGRGATYVDVAEPRLYEIGRVGKERVLRLSPEKPGLTVHAFVFEKRPAAR